MRSVILALALLVGSASAFAPSRTSRAMPKSRTMLMAVSNSVAESELDSPPMPPCHDRRRPRRPTRGHARAKAT